MNDAGPKHSPPPPTERELRTVEIVLSTVLRAGVITSLAVVLAGLVLSFVHHPAYVHRASELSSVLSPARPTLHTLSGLAQSLKEGRGEAIVMVGLLLLIATPVLRVAISVFIFLEERDWMFVIITSFVLAMLILSFLLGKVE